MRNQINNVPSLRFKDFSGEWKYKKLGDYISERNDFSTEDLPLYSLTIAEGIVPKSERYEREFLVNDVSEAYKVMYLNDFAYNPMNLRFGALARHKGNIKVAVSKYYNIFYCNEDANSIFMEYYLTSNKLIQYYDKMSTGSLIEKKRVHYSDFVNFVRLLPSLPEQQKIASFLTTVDDKLQALKKKKTLLEQYKKGVMQKIFSQEIRFRDDNGKEYPAWEEKTLGEISERIIQKNKENNVNVLTISAQYGLVSQLDYYNKSVSSKDVTGYYLISQNDFAYNKSYSNGYPMGAIKRLKNYKKGVVSTLYICFRNTSKFDNRFAEYYFESGLQNNEIEKVAQEGVRNHGLLNIGVNDFFQIRIILPSVPEQIKIANFLTAIDDKINHCQTQIEKTEMWKKGLLQRMFC